MAKRFAFVSFGVMLSPNKVRVIYPLKDRLLYFTIGVDHRAGKRSGEKQGARPPSGCAWSERVDRPSTWRNQRCDEAVHE